MGVEDLASKETAALAATAAAVSPRARELLRRGAVYGLAGVMRATDVAVAAGKGAVRGAREGASKESTTSSRARGQSTRQRKQPARRTRSKTA